MRPNPVKQALKSGKPSVGTWLSLGSITAARFLARSGFAWLTVDVEHSLVDPMVNSRAEAESAVAACLYPPRGNRSVGGSVHALNFQTTPADYFAHADEEVLVVLQCEHIQAVRDADAIFSVPGIDVIFVGPHDLAASMRGPDGRPPGAGAPPRAAGPAREPCRKHGVAAGYPCAGAEEARRFIEEG